jgi:hypothetical protein
MKIFLVGCFENVASLAFCIAGTFNFIVPQIGTNIPTRVEGNVAGRELITARTLLDHASRRNK